MIEIVVPLMVFMAVLGVVIAVTTPNGVSKTIMQLEDAVAHVESQRDEMRSQIAANRASHELLKGMGVSIHDLFPSKLTQERSDYELLLDELQPAEGTATYWALNWHIDDVDKRMTNKRTDPLSWSVPQIAPMNAWRANT